MSSSSPRSQRFTAGGCLSFVVATASCHFPTSLPQASWESYQLTTFAQPIDEIAEAAIDWLAAPAEDHARSEIVELQAPLVWRQTLPRLAPS